MPGAQIANPDRPNGFADGFLYSYFGCPVPRLDGSGGRAMKFVALGLYVSGRSAARQMQAHISNSGGGYIAGSGLLTIPSGAGSTYRNFAVSGFVDGVGQQLRYGMDNAPGYKNFSRSGGGTTYGQYGNYTDGQLAGHVDWVEVCSPPGWVYITPTSGGGVNVQFAGNQDNGGGSVTDYRIQDSESPGFESRGERSTGNGFQQYSFAPGSTHYFRVCAMNEVSNGMGRYGQWSSTISATMLSGGKIYRGGNFVQANTKIRQNNAWVNSKVMIRSGGTWKPAK